MARQVTIKRFDEWKLVAENVAAFFRLMEEGAEPLAFRDACVALKVPYTLMHAFVVANEELHARYRAILKAKGDRHAHEIEGISKTAKDRDSAAAAKVQIDAKKWLAEKWYKELYGETLRVEKDVRIGIDPVLLGRAEELLRLASEKVVAGAELVGGVEAPASLPAARPPAGSE